MVRLSDQDVGHHLTFGATEKSIVQAYVALARGRLEMNRRISAACGDLVISTMSAAWPEKGFALTTRCSVSDGRSDLICTLIDTATGIALCSLQGNQLTRIRTAALSVVAVSKAALCTRKVALFGAGYQGEGHIDAITQRHRVEEIAVVDPLDVNDWCARMSKRCRVRVRQMPAHAAIANADVVITATRSKIPVFDGAMLDPGTLVVAVGTNTPDCRELDDTTLRRASRVILEWLPQSMEEAGEIVGGLNSGSLCRDRIVSIPELIATKSQWRRSHGEIVVFKPVGVGLSDLAAAILVWQSWLKTYRS